MIYDFRQIGTAGYLHLLVFCAVMPWLAVDSSRKMMAAEYPPRRHYFASVIFQQIFFASFSILVARLEWIELFRLPDDPAGSASIGIASLAGMIALMLPRWRRNVEKRDRKLYFFMPRTGDEKATWAFVSMLAGVSEEITYRAVMFVLLRRLTGDGLAAALICAAIFAFCHYVQGPKSMIVIFLLALGFQAMFHFTGSLLVGMGVHFLYDLTAGLMYSHYGEKLGYPIEGISAGESPARYD
jgi:membrane protease YdiL (CAAX protease family)